MPPQRGVWFGAIAQAMRERADLAETAVAEISGEAAQPFAALNAAFFADGYVLSLEPGVVLDAPIEIIHLASGASEASFHTRSLVSLGDGSRASIIETYAGEGRYWRNDVLAARLAEGAVLHRTVRSRRRRRRCISGSSMRRSRANARFAGFALLLGGRRVRHEADVRLAGEGGRVSARRRLPRRRQRRGEHRHHGRSRRARRADQRTGQGRRGGSRPRRVSGLHRSCARARRRPMRASRAAT